MTYPSRSHRQLMNEEQLKKWVLRKLGAPLISVEIHPAQLDDLVEDAKDWFIGKKGLVRYRMVDVASSQVAYEVPDDCDMPIDVLLPASPYDFSLVFSPYILADEKIPYDVFAAPESAGLYSSLAQAIQYTETAKRVLSAEANWMWDQVARVVILSPAPRTDGQMMLIYKSTSLAIDQLKTFDHELVKRYVLAQAKIQVARPRSKYGGFPGAQGERQLDGRDILQEGKDELEKVEEDMFRSCFPVPFITG